MDLLAASVAMRPDLPAMGSTGHPQVGTEDRLVPQFPLSCGHLLPVSVLSGNTKPFFLRTCLVSHLQVVLTPAFTDPQLLAIALDQATTPIMPPARM